MKWVAAVQVHFIKNKTQQWPTFHQIHEWVLSFKSEYENYKFPYDGDIVTNFPTDPNDLPASVYKKCYNDDDPPIRKSIEGFLGLGDYIPLRSNSAALQRERAQGIGHAMLPMRFNASMGMNMQQAQHMQQMMQGQAQQAQHDLIPGFHILWQKEQINANARSASHWLFKSKPATNA